MRKEEIDFLMQLVDALEEAEEKLARFYNERNIEGFNKTKKFALQIQEKISEVVR